MVSFKLSEDQVEQLSHTIVWKMSNLAQELLVMEFQNEAESIEYKQQQSEIKELESLLEVIRAGSDLHE